MKKSLGYMTEPLFHMEEGREHILETLGHISEPRRHMFPWLHPVFEA